MQKPQGYDEAQAIVGGGYPQLPAGGYVCRVVGAKMDVAKDGSDMLVLALDIARGEYKDFFKQAHTRRKEANPDKRVEWPCRYWQLVTPKHVGRLKGLVESFEASNPGYKVPWGENSESTLVNRLIGCVFREEEYIGRNDNKVHTTVRAYSLEPVEGIEDKPAPQKKTVEPPPENSIPDEEIPF